MTAMIAAVDRLERAAMAYERLGKLTRDDEKTRQIRKDTMVELAAARAAILGAQALSFRSAVEPMSDAEAQAFVDRYDVEGTYPDEGWIDASEVLRALARTGAQTPA